MLLPSAVYVSSTFEFGAMFHDFLSASVVHVSSTFEFGAMFHDCLSADPQGNPPYLPFFGAP